MKSEHSVQKSADAALKQAIRLSHSLYNDLSFLKSGHEEPENSMSRIRAKVDELNQRIHEFNAFTNVLLTD